MRRGRTASFTGRLGLNIRSPLTAAENKLAVLLRFFEPPALSPSGFAARGMGDRPNPTDMINKWAVLLRFEEPRGPNACPRAARNTPLTRRELPFLPGVRPTKVKKSRVEAGIKRRYASVYSERHRN